MHKPKCIIQINSTLKGVKVARALKEYIRTMHYIINPIKVLFILFINTIHWIFCNM